MNLASRAKTQQHRKHPKQKPPTKETKGVIASKLERSWLGQGKRKNFLLNSIVLGRRTMEIHKCSTSFCAVYNFHALKSICRVFSAECTIGMVWGLTALKHYGNKALWNYGTMTIRCKLHSRILNSLARSKNAANGFRF